MIKLINGWTKERVMAQVKKYNNGKKAVNDYEVCQYVTPDGNRCVVGCFLPDDHEIVTCGKGQWASVRRLISAYPSLACIMPFEVSDLINFQAVHDSVDGNDFNGQVYKAIEHFLETQVE